MREGLNHLAVNVAKGAGGALWGAASVVGRAVPSERRAVGCAELRPVGGAGGEPCR